MKASYLHAACALLFAACCSAAPAQLGIKFDEKRDGLPTLSLPYGTWKAAFYNPNGDIYTFKNIRFAAPPTGDLRWAKPAPPPQETEVQDGSYGPICQQAPLKGIKIEGPGASSPIGQAANQFLAGIPIPSFEKTSEDCLFLDVHVPGKAIRDTSLKLPVISWFFGGAYILGGKDQFTDLLPFYDGTGVIQQSQGNVIFVTSNYRLGAFGFLAGETMEKEGLPNAGFYDQRAVLQWIQDNIHLVGGDKTQVSAWGESAGAGSILHHLTAFGGTQDPLFSKAFLQSPAFEPLFDRKGFLESTFQNFTSLAGCQGKGVACLRAADADTLASANVKLNEDGPEGTFAVGPAADGNWARQTPVLEFASGNYWKNIDSIMLSHVSDEGELFVPLDISDDQGFNNLLDFSFPDYAKAAGVDKAIEAHYPAVSQSGSPYKTERDRVKAYIGEQAFQCNVRFLTDAYEGKTWNMQYSVFPGLHATDLLPTFYDVSLDISAFGQQVAFPLIPGFGSFSQAYQSYIVSHAQTGDPNTYKKTFNLPPAITWPKPDNSGNQINGVLNVGNLGFSTITDSETGKDTCGFWQQVLAASTILGGYSPPGAVVQPQGLTGVNVTSSNASVNYKLTGTASSR